MLRPARVTPMVFFLQNYRVTAQCLSRDFHHGLACIAASTRCFCIVELPRMQRHVPNTFRVRRINRESVERMHTSSFSGQKFYQIPAFKQCCVSSEKIYWFPTVSSLFMEALKETDKKLLCKVGHLFFFSIPEEQIAPRNSIRAYGSSPPRSQYTREIVQN